jgi:hypothetical protein
MSWFDTKQAAVDPDNPAADEQIPFSEWNAMVTYLKDKIVDKTVDVAAIENDKVLVYKTATSTFVFETPSTTAVLNDLTDVVISGVPADNEVLAYNHGTSKWINQTAAEAGLATVTNLASYLALAGGTMTGNLNMGDYLIDDVDDIQAYDTGGITFRNSAATSMLLLATSGYAFAAMADASMNSHKLLLVTDPTSAQDASTKNYSDTTLYGYPILAGGPMTDGYVLAYDATNGRYEMVSQSAALGLPVVDTTAIVGGSADGTKLMRFEVDGLTTGTTRVMTVPDKDITIADKAEVLLLTGGTMTGDIHGVETLDAPLSTNKLELSGGIGIADTIIDLYGKDNPGAQAGNILFRVPNAAKSAPLIPAWCEGISDTPVFHVNYCLDINDTAIKDMKNSAPTALSGTQKDIEIDIGGTPYYFTVYPTKA